MKKLLHRLNLPRYICNILVDKKHCLCHRYFVGILVMMCGVVIAKTIGHHPTHYIALVGDTLGYGLHGIGLIPFVETLLEGAE